jgi:predicted phage terminase large subunit-like protein
MSEDARMLLKLEQEQWRRQCRQSFISFSIEALSARGETPALHHRLISSELEALARGKRKRLMILAPPGSAKTTYASRLFPAWYFAFRPRSSIIAVSHTQELSETNSGFVQRIVRDHADTLGYSLTNDAKGRWYADNACGYLAGSTGSAILGFRANLAVIDDPIKSRAEAESETSREHAWQWFTNDLLTRLTPDGAIILIATPFHEDDLMGRLQRLQGPEWHVLRLPAIAEEDGDDPLGRKPGEPLWADDQYGYGQRLLEIQAAAEREGRSRDWYAQYQGRPRPPEGAMFKPGNMPVIGPAMLPAIIEKVRAWDLAASAKGDWTVGLLLGRADTPALDHSFIVLDVVRFRGPPEEVRRMVKIVAQADGYGVKVWLPRDPAQAGADQADSYIRMLSGFPVQAERMSGDKATRADAAASQANIGRISLLRAPWNAAFIEELASFPRGVHDDQVDALSLAFSKLEARPPMRINPEALRELGINPSAPAYRPSLGYYERSRFHY